MPAGARLRRAILKLEVYTNINMSKKNLKILVISNLFPSKRCPFHGSFVKNFVDDLTTYNGKENTSYCVLKGRSYKLYEKLYHYFIFYIKIFYYLIFNNYDYIYVHLITHASLPIKIVSYFKKMNLIFNIHGEDLLVKTKLAALLLNLVKPLLYKASLIVVPSYYFKKRTIELLPSIAKEKIYVSASSGVKESFYNFLINKRRNNIIGYVSRIDRGKGWDTLLKAIKILSDSNINIAVEIAGGGSEVNNMLDLIKELNLKNIKYVGPIGHDMLPNFYKQLDIFVFPTKLEESLGLVGLEAMASGVPVIASKIGGIQDYLVNKSNGLYFNYGDEKDLAKKILYLLKISDNDYNDMCNKAYEKSLEYKASIVNKKLFDYIFNL